MAKLSNGEYEMTQAAPPTALVISSFVAASRVGANASAFCLRRLGVETIVIPTVLLGRHPGWGAPGGGPVQAAQLRGLWDGIKAQGLRIDAVMSGYMASPQQVSLAADIIKDVKSTNPEALIIIDPVMGDHGRLYIGEATAKAIRETLLPLADICTPNLWELGYLTGEDVDDAQDAALAAQSLPCSALITSVPFGQDIGALYQQQGEANAVYVTHEKFASVPNGGGDALAGVFLAHCLNGRTRQESLSRAVASIFEIISHAVDTDAGEMPLIRQQNTLETAAPLLIKELL